MYNQGLIYESWIRTMTMNSKKIHSYNHKRTPITARRHEVKSNQLAPRISIPFPRKTYSPRKPCAKQKKRQKAVIQRGTAGKPPIPTKKARSRGCPATYALERQRGETKRGRDKRTQPKDAMPRQRNEAKRKKKKDNKIWNSQLRPSLIILNPFQPIYHSPTGLSPCPINKLHEFGFLSLPNSPQVIICPLQPADLSIDNSFNGPKYSTRRAGIPIPIPPAPIN